MYSLLRTPLQCLVLHRVHHFRGQLIQTPLTCCESFCCLERMRWSERHIKPLLHHVHQLCRQMDTRHYLKDCESSCCLVLDASFCPSRSLLDNAYRMERCPKMPISSITVTVASGVQFLVLCHNIILCDGLSMLSEEFW